MKKHLLTSTALVAAGVMAVSAPAIAGSKSLVLKGDTRQLIGVGENDAAFDDSSMEPQPRTPASVSDLISRLTVKFTSSAR